MCLDVSQGHSMLDMSQVIKLEFENSLDCLNKNKRLV